MIYHRLTAEKVNTVHGLFLFLHKLKVIGTVKTKTVNTPLTEFGRPTRYTLIYEGYDSSTKGKADPFAVLVAFFNRTHEDDDACTEQSE